MKGAGFALALLGVIVALAALFYPTTVSTDTSALSTLSGSYSPQAAGDIYNLGRLQTQMLLFVGGCTSALAGIVLASAAMVLERLMATALLTPPVSLSAPSERSELAAETSIRAVSAEQIAKEKATERGVAWAAGLLVVTALIVGLVMAASKSDAPPAADLVINEAQVRADSMSDPVENSLPINDANK